MGVIGGSAGGCAPPADPRPANVLASHPPALPGQRALTGHAHPGADSSREHGAGRALLLERGRQHGADDAGAHPHHPLALVHLDLQSARTGGWVGARCSVAARWRLGPARVRHSTSPGRRRLAPRRTQERSHAPGGRAAAGKCRPLHTARASARCTAVQPTLNTQERGRPHRSKARPHRSKARPHRSKGAHTGARRALVRSLMQHTAAKAAPSTHARLGEVAHVDGEAAGGHAGALVVVPPARGADGHVPLPPALDRGLHVLRGVRVEDGERLLVGEAVVVDPAHTRRGPATGAAAALRTRVQWVPASSPPSPRAASWAPACASASPVAVEWVLNTHGTQASASRGEV